MSQSENGKIDNTILVVIFTGTFLSVLVSSIVNVALPQMMVIFSATANQIQWILTAYMLVLGVMMPLAGYLGDTFGYKRMYIIALALFTAGSAFCGAAWSLNSIIVARIIQAVGGGLIQPLAMALIYRTYPPSKISSVMGIWGIAAMAGPAIGPTLGGYLIEFASWRWMFLINVPIGALCVFMASLRLKETTLIPGHRFDRVGLITIILGFSTLLMAISNGNKEGWTSPYIVSLFVIAAFSLSILVITELNHAEPLLDLRLLSNPLFLNSLLLGVVTSMGVYGGVFMMPMLIQNVMGQTAFKSGLIMLPAAVAAAVMMPVGAKLLDRFGGRAVIIPGMALMAWASYIMSGFTGETSFSTMTIWGTVRMVGMGIAMMPITIIGMSAIEPTLVGRASSVSSVIRQVAASTGVAMFTSIMQHQQINHLADLSMSLNAGSADMTALMAAAKQLGASYNLGSDVIQALPLALIYKKMSLDALAYGIGDSFLISALICVGGIFVALLLKKPARHLPPEIEQEEMMLLDGAID